MEAGCRGAKGVAEMLVLGRKPGEYLMIGDVMVKVIKEDSGLKLVIDAPKEVPIVRGEVYELEHPRPVRLR